MDFKDPGSFWHEKYMFLDINIVIGSILLFVIVIPNLIHKSPPYSTIIWITGILLVLIVYAVKYWLIWFIERKRMKKT